MGGVARFSRCGELGSQTHFGTVGSSGSGVARLVAAVHIAHREDAHKLVGSGVEHGAPIQMHIISLFNQGSGEVGRIRTMDEGLEAGTDGHIHSALGELLGDVEAHGAAGDTGIEGGRGGFGQDGVDHDAATLAHGLCLAQDAGELLSFRVDTQIAVLGAGSGGQGGTSGRRVGDVVVGRTAFRKADDRSQLEAGHGVLSMQEGGHGAESHTVADEIDDILYLGLLRHIVATGGGKEQRKRCEGGKTCFFHNRIVFKFL